MEKNREFDSYAQGYSGGNEDPLKRLFGQNLDQFIYVKAKWFWEHCLSQEKIFAGKECHLLDYGCGTGEMLRWLERFGFQGRLYGADVSSAIVEEAAKRWSGIKKKNFFCIGETKTDFNDHSFNYIVAASVFHHIEPSIRDNVLQEIRRILMPGGKFVVFEHNPLNPMTRLIVKRAVIDRNAVLLYPNELKSRFNKASLSVCMMNYLMFFPPRMKLFLRLERYLNWCPLGAQYVIVGEK